MCSTPMANVLTNLAELPTHPVDLDKPYYGVPRNPFRLYIP